jgi:hypothetical protein
VHWPNMRNETVLLPEYIVSRNTLYDTLCFHRLRKIPSIFKQIFTMHIQNMPNETLHIYLISGMKLRVFTVNAE